MSKLISVAVALLAFGAIAGEPVVLTHQETNLDATAGEAFAQVCARRYQAVSGVAVQTAANAPAAAKRLELTLVSLAKDGKGRIIADASLRDANGAELRHAQLDAASLEDAPKVCDRLARALVNGTSTDQAMNLSNITRARATSRRTSAAGWRAG